jgi:hypothetical protein
MLVVRKRPFFPTMTTKSAIAMYKESIQHPTPTRRSGAKLCGLALAIGFTVAVPAATAAEVDALAPNIEETKAIAEEGFIYGLPIVTNYAVMQEFAVDKDSGQFKAPFNAIFNDAHVFTYKDTAVVTPNSDTPYSMVWLDLRAEPMVI